MMIKGKGETMENPKIKFCPYCGGHTIRKRYSVPRCEWCRAVFNVNFSRYLRAAPTGKKNNDK